MTLKISAIMIVALLFLAAFGRAATVQINISGFAFLPGHEIINQGDTVRWTNLDGVNHTSTSDNAVWDSGTILPTQSFSFVFNNAGVFPYHCNFHHTMMDTITVLQNPDWTINIGDFFFNPAILQIQPGQIVRRINTGAHIHTSTSDNGFWNSDSINPGGLYDHTFPAEGVFHYHCELHPTVLRAGGLF